MKRIYLNIKNRDLKFIFYAAACAFSLMLLILYIFPLEFSSYRSIDSFSSFWYILTETGSGTAAVIWTLSLVLFLKIYCKKRVGINKNFYSFILIFLISLISISSLSHFIWKDLFQVPRPSIVLFEKEGLIFSKDEQFAELSTSQRSKLISEAISISNSEFKEVNPDILKSWIKESGYSFPSGHSQTAFFLGVLFSFILYKTLNGKWKYFSLAPLIWAISIGISRVVIGVHYPVDVAAGAFMGMTLALILITFTKFAGLNSPSQK
jgi:phosphatidylglycerophosphatase B